jgi:hypothetical protein
MKAMSRTMIIKKLGTACRKVLINDDLMMMMDDDELSLIIMMPMTMI